MGDRTSGSEPAQPATPARRCEAAVLIGDGLADAPEVRAVVDDLIGAAMPVLVVGPGQDALGALDELWRRGISPENTLVLVDGSNPGLRSVLDLPDDAVVVHLDDGAHEARDLLVDQRERRARGALPDVASAPGWVLTIEGFDPDQERVRGALLTVADGIVGSCGAPSVAHPSAQPLVLHAGVYDGGDGPETHLLEGPVPERYAGDLDTGSVLRRTLDLLTGVLHEELRTPTTALESVRFSSLVRRGLLVKRVRADHGDLAAPDRLLGWPTADESAVRGAGDGAEWISAGGTPGGLAVAARLSEPDATDPAVRTQLTAYVGDPEAVPPAEEALDRLAQAQPASFDHLLDEHRAAWAVRWADADVVVEGDDDLQLALRFSLFHLMGSAADAGEAAVGARGLSGSGYRGHVFWDGDTFTLPFFAATHPSSARAMLEYRLRRLPAAMAAAREMGRSGARFPWESARTGRDVTPHSALDRTGRLIPIRTGWLEEHIVADVAWAARCYVDWTGDDVFARGPGLPLFVETARYWASRIRVTADGRAHVYGVIGPDEYHEPVDDNAFTNVMARWNLREAAALSSPEVAGGGSGAVSAEERHRWLELADALLDGYDADTGLYEQCAGFFGLEPLIVAEVLPRRPIAADLLLGIERVRSSQVIKQADVLMLHHLVPGEVEPGTLEPNLRFYEPRTAHGSSLSPAIHASLFARARDFDGAMQALQIASRIDLDDLTGTTAGGIHLGAAGGLWQALAYGFLGLRPGVDHLDVDPCLPTAWRALTLHLRFHGAPLRVRADHDSVTVTCTSPLSVGTSKGTLHECEPPGRTYRLSSGRFV